MSVFSVFTRFSRKLSLSLLAIKWRFKLSRSLCQSSLDCCSQSRSVFILSIYSSPEWRQFESYVASALSSKGCNVTVCVDRFSLFNLILFFGLRKIRLVSYAREVSLHDRSGTGTFVTQAIGSWLLNTPSFLNFSFNGVRIGLHSSSHAVRLLKAPSLLSDSFAHQQQLAKSLSISFDSICVWKSLIRSCNPDLIIATERGYSPCGELFDISLQAGIPFFQVFGGISSSSISGKRYSQANHTLHPLSIDSSFWTQHHRYLGWSALEKKIQTSLENKYLTQQWFNRQNLMSETKVYSRDALLHLLGAPPHKKIACIFSHVLYDATFFYGKSLYEDYSRWLLATLKCAAKNQNLHWVVKVHPANTWRESLDSNQNQGTSLETRLITNELGPLPSHITILEPDTSINTLSLYRCIDYGLTVRGTPGMELPCFGVPTLTAGTGRYDGLGFTIDSATRDDYENRLLNLHSIKPLNRYQIALARRHAWYAFEARQLPLDSCQIRYGGGNSARQGVDLSCGIKSPFSTDSDIDILTKWMLGGSSDDLLDPCVFDTLTQRDPIN